VDWVREAIKSSTHTQQILTLNPEIVVRAQEDEAVKRCIQESELVTADGVGIVWAAKRLCGVQLEDRVTGVDLSIELMRQIKELRVFFLGSKPGVAERASKECAAKYGIRIAGVQDGYFNDEAAVVNAIAQAKPDLLLVGMGERQDSFIHRHKAQLGARVAMGVGGTIDVLAGEVERMPEWSQKLKIEWLLRVGLDRRRWGRFPRLLRFVGMVLREERGRRKEEGKGF
jgi:N-acetylglucosaminyldiphosphoundecaprenol N-acetyl-beta-D-mannosaminyltransferase